MTPSRTVDFAPVASSLRNRVIAHYEARAEPLEGAAGHNTLETNSGWVERRSAPLLRMLAARGLDSIAGRRVADLGCGFGAMSVFLAASGASVVGVDPNTARLEVGRSVAAEHGLDATFVEGRMEALEMLGAEAFDVAVVNNSLCYLVERRRREAGLREALRILRPGGWIVTRNPNRWNPVDQFTGLPLIHLLPPGAANRASAALGRPRSAVRLASPPAARRELRAAGFTGIRQAGFDGRRPDFLRPVARYQHFVARRPDRDGDRG